MRISDWSSDVCSSDLFPNEGRKPGVKEDIDRVAALWRQCRSRYGADGPFLFGRFTIADAVFAPVVTRFRTYEIGRASCRERVCQYVYILVVSVSSKNNHLLLSFLSSSFFSFFF